MLWDLKTNILWVLKYKSLNLGVYDSILNIIQVRHGINLDINIKVYFIILKQMHNNTTNKFQCLMYSSLWQYWGDWISLLVFSWNIVAYH